MKMTAADYLRARGWRPYYATMGDYAEGKIDGWTDPLPSREDRLVEADAIDAQRARDAEEERKAWVAFAAAAASMTANDGDGNATPMYAITGASGNVSATHASDSGEGNVSPAAVTHVYAN